MKEVKFNKSNKDLIIENRFKKFSPEKKLELAMQLYYSAKELKRAALKEFHPDWDETKIEEKLREIFLYART